MKTEEFSFLRQLQPPPSFQNEGKKPLLSESGWRVETIQELRGLFNIFAALQPLLES
jgi:hypothetical protein